MEFNTFEKVRHVKTNTVYVIIGFPGVLFIESTGEGAYAYQEYGKQGSKIWVRSKKEMEDGRFVLEG